MTKSNKRIIGYKFCGFENRDQCGEYRHLSLDLHCGVWRDSAKEYASNPNEYYLDRMRQIRETQSDIPYRRSDEGTLYVSAGHDDRLTFEWQDDRERRAQWYACRVGEFRPSVRLVQILAKIMRKIEERYSVFDLDPSELVAILDEMGAIPVKYAEPMDAWVPDWSFDLAEQIDRAEPAQESAA